ncbi:DUF6705 family protein [Bizionia sp. KMM 8389]
MKNIILISMISIAFISCKAQTIYDISTPSETVASSNNYYMKDINNYNDAFVGVWRWEDGSNSFEITLQEFEMYSDPISPNIYRDAIYGKYTYIENNIVVSETTSIGTFVDFKLYLVYKSPTVYSVVISDVVSNDYKGGTFTLLNANTAILELKDVPGIRLDNQTNGEFSLPTNVVMVKQ